MFPSDSPTPIPRPFLSSISSLNHPLQFSPSLSEAISSYPLLSTASPPLPYPCHPPSHNLKHPPFCPQAPFFLSLAPLCILITSQSAPNTPTPPIPLSDFSPPPPPPTLPWFLLSPSSPPLLPLSPPRFLLPPFHHPHYLPCPPIPTP